ncbi:NitT/TauT family transport system permease protein [Halogranum amylolyticum]|uniref:NitT/TauT family transport system permease protein n=1 Tax=Halogranum amylolyticum TaxID=660520 RepID=A0A1H8TJL5_9EURY|nr:ABC transporter permease [Halogranum amylolyticum]SEO90688.1 NitT/TauT family transport system permease protein [Halogranum amylolyticum]
MSVADRVSGADIGLPAAALVVGLLGWWTVTAAGVVPSFVLPSPVTVAERLLTRPGLYVSNALSTLAKTLVGGTIGIVGGATLAVAISWHRLLRRALHPYLVAARVLPKVAVAPLLLLYVGLGFETALLFVALVTFFPMVVNTVAGLQRAPEVQRDLLRSVDAGRVRSFLAVELPYALPDVFAGLKQSVTLAVVGATISEWIVATKGLGYLILVGSENVQPDVMLAALTVLVAIGLGLYGTVVVAQRAVARRLPLD